MVAEQKSKAIDNEDFEALGADIIALIEAGWPAEVVEDFLLHAVREIKRFKNQW